jgi:Cu(I)/Ag(I) efflux system membrane fusion protein
MKYLFILLAILGFAACAQKRNAVVQQPDQYYTCSMHPQVRQEGPGKCPICGMDLILVQKGKDSQDNTIVLSDQQVQLGNIHADTISAGTTGGQLILPATLSVDETKSTAVNARVAGRIDKLYVKSTGQTIHKGDKLYDLYSEELNTAKQEYLLAIEQEQTLDNSIIDFKQLVESAKNKLLLWGMSNAQIKALELTKQSSALTTFYSPVNGSVGSIPIEEGEYVASGGTILRVFDLSALWVEAQVYTTQIAGIDLRDLATVQLPDIAGWQITGKIEFINPEVDPSSRINLVRVIVSNTDGVLHPGMAARVILHRKVTNAWSLPARAVMQDGQTSWVWVQTAHNTYHAVRVETGTADGIAIATGNGLRPGDLVVTSGTYLLNSEYIFKHGSAPVVENHTGF